MPATSRFELNSRSLREGARWLSRRDPSLGAWMERVGEVGLRRQAHRFGALCRSITAQQISAHAARTIHGRFLELFPGKRADPGRLLRLGEEELRGCGLSTRKVQYLRALAREFEEGELARLRLGALDSPEVIEVLTRVPGIGVWTAQMFLIFSLGRIDVFSVGDAALRAGVERVAGRSLDADQVEARAAQWSPYRSVASLYLWKIAHLPTGAAPR